MEIDYVKMGKQLKRIRKARGMKQRGLCGSHPMFPGILRPYRTWHAQDEHGYILCVGDRYGPVCG